MAVDVEGECRGLGPSIVCMTFTSAPLMMASEAAVWRSLCGVRRRWPSPAARTAGSKVEDALLVYVRLHHVSPSGVEVHPAHGEGRRLAPAQSGVAEQPDEQPVRACRFGERLHLDHIEIDVFGLGRPGKRDVNCRVVAQPLRLDRVAKGAAEDDVRLPCASRANQAVRACQPSAAGGDTRSARRRDLPAANP